jgi:hypothetical protein
MPDELRDPPFRQLPTIYGSKSANDADPAKNLFLNDSFSHLVTLY